MRAAFGQALRYANYLPDGKPPFLITCDIGNVFEIWTGFGGQYGGYGARRTIEFAQLADPAVREYFVKIFNDPLDLDPARHAQRVTREVAAKLADLARALEADPHDPELVAQFLMRSIFTMFCEDVGLLPDKLFTSAIRDHWIPNPRMFQAGVEQLWQAMRDGSPFGFVGKLLRFNGGLFNTWQSLPMTEAQLRLLQEAAACDWANVEPAIFGTLVERALDPVERRALGAHFTPREYIERLVRPAVIEPVRAEWEIAQAEARQIMESTLTPVPSPVDMKALTPNPSPVRRERGAEGGERAPKIEMAREFRKNPTDTEDVLWQALRDRQLGGRKFRRQHPVDGYIVDFYCHEARLAVEVDGPIHDGQQEHDELRQEAIEKHGIRFVRLKSEDVELRLTDCLREIEAALTPVPSPVENAALTPVPSPVGRERGAEGGVREPSDADRKKAAAVIRRFHSSLVHTRVLDPACGSGNFLYVTLDLFKEIEAEVLRELTDLGDRQSLMEVEGLSVNPGQFLGIEINPRAREIADLVLWLGYLQWQRRVYGERTPPEPVLQPYKNIVCRDAVLDYDDVKPRLDADGKPITTWDQRTFKTSAITGKEVPDEDARVPVFDYVNARPAEWPEADYVVSNPPFVGDKMMRFALGDGYVETLRATYPNMGHSDLVMYWWEKAAGLVRAEKLKRFGFITTNSITQVFNRKVIECALTPGTSSVENSTLTPVPSPVRRERGAEGGVRGPRISVALAWAIPDHPWVDAGADVRIAMTVGVRADRLAGQPVLGEVTFEEREQFKEPQARRVEIAYRIVPRVHADLSGGANLTSCVPLAANVGLSSFGMMLAGRGFVLSENEYHQLLCGGRNAPVLKRLVNARDIVQKDRGLYVIDFFGLTVEEAAQRYPEPYQRLLDHVKPERDANRSSTMKDNWWLFGRTRPALRETLRGLRRYVAVPETSKHIPFVLVDIDVLVEHGAIAFALEDAFFFGVMSSRLHHIWSLEVGSTLEDRPRYRNNTCFDPFPFPDATDEQKARIRELGERLDAHRKRVQAEHPDVTLTGMYNALEALRALTPSPSPVENAALTPPSAPLSRRTGEGLGVRAYNLAFHERALIGILKQIHDELDAAVAEAYGWPVDLPDDEILTRLVALNHERAEEEKRGIVRWLRPEFQNPGGRTKPAQAEMDVDTPEPASPKPQAASLPWPKEVPEQLKAIRDWLASQPGLWSASDIAAAFKGARKSAVEKHVRSLESLGLLVSAGDGDAARWGAVSR
ncbi:MAG: DUF559 domain-containing protein [Deltaproteobacteria bacterium]|nr:DUF559 domain-containing protein [Deltaproteobacteria bacterium]